MDRELSLKVWRSGEDEPLDPQLVLEDTMFSSGALIIFNFASFHQSPTVVDGVWDDITFTPGTPAEASAEAVPAAGTAPLAVRLSAEAIGICNGPEFEWHLPDGEVLEGQEVDHVFEEAGRHVVTLSLRSENGCRASTRVTVLVHPAPGDLGPWQASIIGEPDFGVVGDATEGEHGSSLDLVAGGRRLTGRSDAFGFVHRELGCDGAIVARLDAIERSRPNSQIGLQLRESPDTGARHASLVLETQGFGHEFVFLHRPEASANTRRRDPQVSEAPVWLRLERRGDLISASWSSDGESWNDAGQVELPGLGKTLLAGVVAIANEPQDSFLLLRTRFSGVDLRCDESPAFRRGDTNGDGAVDLSDPIATFGHLFLGSAKLTCPDAADADDSGTVDLSDGIFTLGFLFRGTSAPPEPGPDACGPDAQIDELGDCADESCP